MLRVTELIRYLKASGLQPESNALLSLAQEQLSLFDSNEDLNQSSGYTLSDSEDSEEDRYDLSGIEFESTPMPDSQVGPRKAIMLALLRGMPTRDKQEIIDEVMMLPNEPANFEQATQNYRDVYPELNYEAPSYIPPRQVRMRGVEPAIRFTPELGIVEEDLAELRLEDEAYEKRKEEAIKQFVEDHGREPSAWQAQDLTPGKKSDIEAIEKRVGEFKNLLSPEKYSSMEQDLRSLYERVEGTKAEFMKIINEAKDQLPPEPTTPNPEEFRDFGDYIEDLKSRIYYYSYEVLSNSAGKSIFGAKTGREDKYRYPTPLIEQFFNDHENNWFIDSESLKDFLEETPSLVSSQANQGRNNWSYWRVTITSWHEDKARKLEAYDAALRASIDSYRRGLRFIKRLKRALNRELESRIEGLQKSGHMQYVEQYARDELDIVYQDVVNTLENQIEPTGRYNYYNNQIGAMGNATKYGTSGEHASKDISLFDINLLFHNKIKMYEVINHFASLIFTIIKRTSERVQAAIIAPGLKKAADDICLKTFYDIFGISEDEMRGMTTFSMESHLSEELSYSDRSTQPFLAINKESIEILIRGWSEEADRHGVNFKGMFVYPKFLLKNPETKPLVIDQLKRRAAENLFTSFISKADDRRRHVVQIMMGLIDEGEISFKNLEGPGMEHIHKKIMSYSEKISKAEVKRLMAETRTSPFARRSNMAKNVRQGQEVAYAKESGLYSSYGELIRVTASGGRFGPDVRASQGRQRAEEFGEAVESALEGMSTHPGYDGSIIEAHTLRSLKEGLRGSVISVFPGYILLAKSLMHELIYYDGLSFRGLHSPLVDGPAGESGDEPDARSVETLIANKDNFLSELGIPRFIINSSKGYQSSSTWPIINHLFQDVLPEGEMDTDHRGLPQKLQEGKFLDENLINLINKMEFINIVSEEMFKEIAEKYKKEGIFADRYNDTQPFFRDPPGNGRPGSEASSATAWDIDVKQFYRKYIKLSEELNDIVTIAMEIPKAKDQFQSIVYAGRIQNIFEQRMSFMKEVGPRGMAKSYSVLNKRLRNKKMPFNKLIKIWERELTEQMSDEVGLVTASLFERGRYHHGRTGNGPFVDKSLSFYSQASRGLSDISNPAYSVSILIANKFELSHAQQFEKILNIAEEEYSKISERNFGYLEIKQFFNLIFTNMDGLKGKLAKIFRISSFAHNRGHGLSTGYFARMMNDPNFKDFGKNNTVNKYFDMCTKLAKLGGLANIRRRYQPIIDSLLVSKMLSRGFYKRVREAYRICREGLRIRPNLEGLSEDSLQEQLKLRKLMETVDVELTAVRDYSAYEEYNEHVVTKDKKLFDLNWEVKSKNFRFRVLKTYDPTHFKVGVDTQCCQRLGGLGEGAAIDSYVNPLAGVVLLEFYINGSWGLAAQSYFHYVPQDNGYILDNVETNRSYIGSSREITGYSKETLYAMLAKRVEENFNIEYFLSGKGYSEIEVGSYDSKRLPYDPRDFAWRKKYTDWRASGSINLLSPKFDVPELPKGKKDRVKKISQFHNQVFSPKEAACV